MERIVYTYAQMRIVKTSVNTLESAVKMNVRMGRNSMKLKRDGTCSILNDDCPEKNADCKQCNLNSVFQDYQKKIYFIHQYDIVISCLCGFLGLMLACADEIKEVIKTMDTKK